MIYADSNLWRPTTIARKPPLACVRTTATNMIDAPSRCSPSIVPKLLAPAVLVGGAAGVVVTAAQTVGTDAYARAFLCWSATLNLAGAIPHWFLPDAGLETIAKIDLGPGKNKGKMFCIFLHGEEGQHRFFEAVIAYFVALGVPETRYSWLLLGLYCIQQLCNFLTHKLLKSPDWSRGYEPPPARDNETPPASKRAQGSEAPGRFRFVLSFAIVCAPFVIRLAEAAAGRPL